MFWFFIRGLAVLGDVVLGRWERGHRWVGVHVRSVARRESWVWANVGMSTGILLVVCFIFGESVVLSFGG